MEIEGNFYKGFFWDIAAEGKEKYILLFVYDPSIKYFPDHLKPYTAQPIDLRLETAEDFIDRIREEGPASKLPEEEFPKPINSRNLWRFPVSIKR